MHESSLFKKSLEKRTGLNLNCVSDIMISDLSQLQLNERLQFKSNSLNILALI